MLIKYAWISIYISYYISSISSSRSTTQYKCISFVVPIRLPIFLILKTKANYITLTWCFGACEDNE